MPDAKTPPTTPSKLPHQGDPDKDGDGELSKEEQLEEGLEETFPASDTPAEVQPHGDSKTPAPSTSGGD